MCPRGLSPEDTWAISSVSLTGRGPVRKGNFVVSASQEEALYIYFNEQVDDVNRRPSPGTSCPLLSHIPSIHHLCTFYPFWTNPACKHVFVALSTGLDFSSAIGIQLCCQIMDGILGVLFRSSFVRRLVKKENWQQKSGGKCWDWIIICFWLLWWLSIKRSIKCYVSLSFL